MVTFLGELTNGKELQDELGLNMYDMDMRQYDPAIARWVVLDPVIHHSMSPYNAFDNNPVFWADPSGADAEQSSGSSDSNNSDSGSKDYNPSGIRAMGIPIEAVTATSAGGGSMNSSTSNSANKQMAKALGTLDEMNEQALNGDPENGDPTILPRPENGKPSDVWGKMTISTNVNSDAGIDAGHAWLTFTSADGSVVKTLSLWGNQGDQEFFADMELNYTSEVTRTTIITNSDIDYINYYNSNINNVNWTPSNTCAGYSSNVWTIITGEELNSRTFGGYITSPATLAGSINEANGIRNKASDNQNTPKQENKSSSK